MNGRMAKRQRRQLSSYADGYNSAIEGRPCVIPNTRDREAWENGWRVGYRVKSANERVGNKPAQSSESRR